MVGRTAIVGAGIAGLTARQVLTAAGMDVDLFDKGRGPGGRTSRRGIDQWHFDHGAQYFTARAPEFIQAVNRWTEEGHTALWEPRIGSLMDGEFLESRGSVQRFVGVPGMNQVAKRLLEEGSSSSGSTSFETTITTVRPGWFLRDTDDVEYGPYEKLIVTTPPAQARALVPQESSAQVPLIGAEADPCWALMVALDEPIDTPFDAAFIRDGSIRWIARNNSKPGRPDAESWVFHADPVWSDRNIESTPQEVVDELTAHAGDLLKPWLPEGFPPGIRAVAHRWRYAQPRSFPGNTLPDDFWWSPEENLGLCGDWCCAGRVEGAYLSGLRLARRILDAR